MSSSYWYIRLEVQEIILSLRFQQPLDCLQLFHTELFEHIFTTTSAARGVQIRSI